MMENSQPGLPRTPNVSRVVEASQETQNRLQRSVLGSPRVNTQEADSALRQIREKISKIRSAHDAVLGDSKISVMDIDDKGPQLQQQIRELRERCAELDAENERLTTTADISSQKAADAQTELLIIEKQCGDLTKNNEDLVDLCQKQVKMLREREQIINQSQSQIKQLEQQVNDLTEQNQTFQQQLQQVTTELEEQNQLNTVESEVTQQRFESIQIDYDTAKQELERLRESKQKQTSVIKDMRQELQDHSESAQQFDQIMQQMVERDNGRKEQIVGLRAQNSEMTTKIQELEEVERDLTMQLDEVIGENQKNVDTIQQLQENVKQLESIFQKEKDVYTARIDELSAKLLKVAGQNQQLIDEARKVQEDKVHSFQLQNDVNVQSTIIEELRRRNGQLLKAENDLITKLKQIQSEDAVRQQKVSQAENILEDVRAQQQFRPDDAIVQQLNRLKTPELKIQYLLDRCYDLQQSVNDLRDVQRFLENELNKQQKHVFDAWNKAQNAAALSTEVEMLEAENGALNDMVDQLQGKQFDLLDVGLSMNIGKKNECGLCDVYEPRIKSDAELILEKMIRAAKK